MASCLRSTTKLSKLQWQILLDLAYGDAPRSERLCCHSESERTATLRALARLERRGLVIREPWFNGPTRYSLAVPIRVLYLAAADSSCEYAVAIADVLRHRAEERERRRAWRGRR